MSNSRLPIFSDCAGWPRNQVRALHYLKDHAVDITRETYISKVDTEARKIIETNLGYDSDFPITKDWHVRYCRVPELGVYYMVHSGIEVVFATPEQIERAEALGLAEDEEDAIEDGLEDADEIDAEEDIRPRFGM